MAKCGDLFGDILQRTCRIVHGRAHLEVSAAAATQLEVLFNSNLQGPAGCLPLMLAGIGTWYHVDLQVDASQRNVVLQSCPHGTSLSILLGLQFSRGQVGSGGPVLVTHAPRAQHSKL